jgi:hypothetical protein
MTRKDLMASVLMTGAAPTARHHRGQLVGVKSASAVAPR